jgi:hypothetical protein
MPEHRSPVEDARRQFQELRQTVKPTLDNAPAKNKKTKIPGIFSGLLEPAAAPRAKKDRPKAVSIAFAQKILGSSDNFVGVGKQEPKPEPGHGNEDA